MYTQQPKKLLIMNILDILRRYTDEDHRLSQKEIQDILKKEYNMTANRKAVRRNLMDLEDFGYQIEYSETLRMTPVLDPKTKKPVTDPKTGKPILEETSILSDFYLVRDFTDGELRLLIDGLLFSTHVPYRQCKTLVEKLEQLSNIYFRSHIRHISILPDASSGNQQLFLNIELLDEAISNNRKVTFKYTEYGTDKKVHIKTTSDGTERVYRVTPYQMAAREGKYYLICNYDPYDDVSNYRLDRIRDLTITEEQGKPFETLQWSHGRRLDLGTYMKEHPYMYSSDNARIKLRIKKAMVTDVIDLFGKDVVFSDASDQEVTVTVYANELATEQFARNFAPDVIVLEPQSLADKIRESMEESVRRYRKEINR